MSPVGMVRKAQQILSTRCPDPQHHDFHANKAETMRLYALRNKRSTGKELSHLLVVSSSPSHHPHLQTESLITRPQKVIEHPNYSGMTLKQ